MEAPGRLAGSQARAGGRNLPGSERPRGPTLLISPQYPSPPQGHQYIFWRLGRMASLMKEKTTRIPKRLPRLPLVK